MNERYLFRGKRIGTDIWVYGGFALDAADNPRIICKDRSGKGLIFHEIIPETVGQFTGITDKNGVKVFEGDRFKTPNGFVGRIEWGHKVYIDKKNIYECHGWLYVNDSNNHSETLDSEILAGEIIGNIFDNDKAVNP